jgi:hypothetical protein
MFVTKNNVVDAEVAEGNAQTEADAFVAEMAAGNAVAIVDEAEIPQRPEV